MTRSSDILIIVISHAMLYGTRVMFRCNSCRICCMGSWRKRPLIKRNLTMWDLQRSKDGEILFLCKWGTTGSGLVWLHASPSFCGHFIRDKNVPHY